MKQQRREHNHVCPIIEDVPRLLAVALCHICSWQVCYYDGDVAEFIPKHGFPVSGNRWWKENAEFIAHGIKISDTTLYK